MSRPAFAFTAPLWRSESNPAWVFLTLPPEHADAILELVGDSPRGFGAVRVEVTIGATTWRTSVFPDDRRRSYVLPVKRAVRAAEGLTAGEPAAVEVVLV